MINVSNNYKQALTQPRTIDAKITYNSTTINIDDINSIKRSFNSTLFKTIAKQVIIDSNVSIDKDKTINPQFGLYLDNQFEYVSLGSYKVKNTPNLNKDTNSYEITAYDKIVESMVSYELTNSDITYPCTVRQLFVSIFTKLGWSTSGIPSTFVNSTSMIEEDVYSNVNMTYRDVLDELCTISCMFLIDVNGTLTLKQKTTTSETINEDFMSDTNVQIKNQVFFNSLVFSRASNSDNIYRKDDTSIANNGLHEFKVSDLQILSLNWRDNFIDAMWNYIKTFTYYAYEVNTIGITYLEPIDTFTLSTFGSTYSTILLNSDLTIANGVNEKIYANEPLESETEYKYADTTDKRINKTNLIVDKQKGEITALVSQVDGIENELSTPTSTKTGTYFDLEDALDSPLIDFKMYGNTSQSGTPTPSSPQEIHNVSGDNTIEICGKNYFDLSLIPTTSNSSYSINNNELTVTCSSANANCYLYFDVYGIKPSTTYNFSYNAVADKYAGYFIREYRQNGTYGSLKDLTEGTDISQSITTHDNAEHLRIYFYASRNTSGASIGDKTIYSNIQLEENNTKTLYQPYQSQTQLISLGVENLFDKDNANYINAYINVSTMKFALSSTVKTYYISCKPNTTYTISKTLTAQFRVGTSANIPVVGGTLLQAWNNNSATQYTITTDSQAKYLCICVRNSSSDTKTEEEVLASVQIEKGSKANSYSEYGKPYIELNKISTYQDYIYKDNDRWYLHKEIGHYNGKINYASSPYNSTYIRTAGSFEGNWVLSTNPKGYVNYYSVESSGSVNVVKENGKCMLRQSSIENINNLYFWNTNITSNETAKTYMDNTIFNIYYQLATLTDTEITSYNYPVLLEQLNNLMTLPLYKNMTHITLTPNDLQPTMEIEYYRDTNINNNYLPKQEIDNYYTKVETNAQIQISSDSISSEVARVETKTDNNNGLISDLNEKITTNQSSNVLEINALKKTVYEDGVEMLENSLVKIDVNGINVSKTNENFNTQITNKTFEIRDNTRELALIGYDSQENRTVARMNDIESKRATIGVHRCETIGTGANKRTAWFYVGGGS